MASPSPSQMAVNLPRKQFRPRQRGHLCANQLASNSDGAAKARPWILAKPLDGRGKIISAKDPGNRSAGGDRLSPTRRNFMGWYMTQTNQRNGRGPWRYAQQYLA